MNPDLTKLQELLQYQFNNVSLLKTALTHRSSLNEQKGAVSNERSEFLGDAVLELVISEFLFIEKPTEPEGVLTINRSAIVRTESLAEIAKNLHLGEYLIMSKGEESTGGRTNKSLLANATEAVIGAIFLDSNFEKSKEFILRHMTGHARLILKEEPIKDYKGKLQELVQKQGFSSPNYKEVASTGPDHDKTFTVEVYVNSKPISRGEGKNKQEAEQQAAQLALKLI